MNLSSISIKRPVATIMITLMVVVLGVYSMISIAKDLLPSIEAPMSLVITTYPGASPEEIETMVTEPLEQSLASVENLDQMSSFSSENTSIVLVQFNVGTDMDFASLNMREAIDRVSGYLPEDADKPMVIRMNMDMMPVLQVYITGDMDLARLNSLIQDKINSEFERCSGVASVSMMGGVEEEIAVEFNQERLAGYGLNLATVSQILAAENINLPSGDVNKGSNKIIVRTMGEFDSIEDIQNLPVTVADYSVVRLGEIATITRGYADQDAVTRVDGNTAIGVMVSKQSDANTVDVCERVNKTIEKLRAEYPELSFVVGYDSSDYINNSLESVAKSAIEGAVLAILMVFLFLGNIRTTLVIAISIPTSLLATFAMMHFRGMSLNLITLCSLTLVVGMLVDNSIVVLENIFRVRQTEKTSASEAANQGSKEIFMAIIASTLTTILVFLPIAFGSGIASMLFEDFCFTIVIALIASLVVALTVVPMFCSKLLQGNVPTTYLRVGTRRYKYKLVPKIADLIESMKDGYRVYVVKALRNRKKFMALCLAGFVASMALVAIVGWELMPEMDEGSISITVETPYGTSLEAKDEILTEIEKYVLTVPEVQHLSVTSGSLGMMSTGENGTVTILLSDRGSRKRSTKEVAADIEDGISHIAGANITVSGSEGMSSMFASHDVSVNLMGKDLEELENIGDEIVAQLKELDCVEMAETSSQEGNPEVKVIIDRNAASQYGITSYQLANGLSAALKGTGSTNISLDGNDIKIKLSLSDDYSNSIENMKQVMIVGSKGTAATVEQIAQFEYDNSPTQVSHYNQTKYISINVDTIGKDLAKASKEVNKVIDDYPLPEGYYYDSMGMDDQMAEMFEDLSLAMIVAILLVFLVLAAQFESIVMPFIVIMAIPFAMSGAFLAMFITNTALSMTSFLGLITLVGVVVNTSILLVEFINQNKRRMGRDEALVQAGVLRLRPIIMSAGTTVIGMIPLSLGLGDGGELLAPTGIAIMGGLIASTVVTLFIIPVLYAIIDDGQINRANRREEKRKVIAELEAKWAKEDGDEFDDSELFRK